MPQAKWRYDDHKLADRPLSKLKNSAKVSSNTVKTTSFLHPPCISKAGANINSQLERSGPHCSARPNSTHFWWSLLWSDSSLQAQGRFQGIKEWHFNIKIQKSNVKTMDSDSSATQNVGFHSPEITSRCCATFFTHWCYMYWLAPFVFHRFRLFWRAWTCGNVLLGSRVFPKCIYALHGCKSNIQKQ